MSSPLDRRPVRFTLVVALLITFVVLACWSMSGKSITTDEVPHITAGYSYWMTGDYRLNPEHPPLAKLLAGIPLLFLDPVLDTRNPKWEHAEQDMGIAFGFDFFFETPSNLANHRTILFWARVPIVLVGMVFCLYMYLLARLLYGNGAALVTLVLATFSPTVLAHARLVTTDVTLTAFWIGAIYHMIRFTRNPTWGQLILCGLTTGLAMAAKFTGIFTLLFTGFVCLLSLFMRGGPWSARPGQDTTADFPPRLLRWMLHMAVYTAIAVVVVVVLYAFHEFPRYINGFWKVWVNHDPRYKAFFCGASYSGIIWPYYLVGLCVKMPLGTLILALLGALWRKRTGSPLSWSERLFLLLPAAFIFSISTVSGKYLGIRYVLPCIPLILLLAGRTVRISWASRLPGILVPAGLTAFVAVSTLMAFPDYIPYFNEAAGGSRGGAALLDDSNIDWGQDWIIVAEFQREHEIPELRYWAHNHIDPVKPYGIKGSNIEEMEFYLPREGWYAVGAHTLNRDVLCDYYRKTNFDWRTRYEPVAILGGSTYVYRFWIDRPGHHPPSGFKGTVLTEEQRFKEAIERFEQFTRNNPTSSGLAFHWARLYYMMGRREEARAKLAECRQKATANIEAVKAGIAKMNLWSPDGLTQADKLTFERFSGEFNEVLDAADCAYNNFDPDMAIDCVSCARWILNVTRALPPMFQRFCMWRRMAVDDLLTYQVLAFAHASRFAISGKQEDAEEASRHGHTRNLLARQMNIREVLDVRKIIQQEQMRYQQWRVRNVQPGMK